MDLKRVKFINFRIPRGYRSGHSVQLLRSGGEYFNECEKIIDSAEKYIHFQTYIVEDDETGQRFVDALARAARRGVRVYFLLDAYGGRSFSKRLQKVVEEAGVLFRKFSPVFITRGFHLSLRLHHKVLFADGKVAIIGGINIANRYSGLNCPREWLDFAVLLRGPECQHILGILKKLWNKKFLLGSERSKETIQVPERYPYDVRVKINQNNWYRNKIEILKSYRTAVRRSKKRITLFASYFLPGRSERKLLRNASKRGVKIRIVLSAVSDTWLFNKATLFLYHAMLSNNIRVFEYIPSVMHAKVATVDGIWSSIGSYNMNHLSDYGSVELNADILDTGFANYFEGTLNRIIHDDCREITMKEYSERKTLYFRATGWISYQLIRFSLRVMFLLTTKTSKPVSM